MGEGRVDDERPEKRRGLDLSVPQVAGSAVAAVVAAKLASNLGVYGTIMGAGVVSVLGTCGGSLLQHVFHRTGRHVHEVAGHVHEAATSARPKVRPLPTDPALDPASRAAPDPGTTLDGISPHHTALDRTALDRTALDRTALDGTAGTTRAESTGHLAATGDTEHGGPRQDTGRTAEYANDGGRFDGADPSEDGGYSQGTVHRARGLRWKRPAAAVALAFGLTMGGITVCELASGQNISGHGHGTTIGDAFTGHDPSHSGKTPSPGDTDHPSGGTSSSPRGTGDPTPSGTGPGPATTAPTAPAPSRTPTAGSGDGTETGGGTGGSDGSGATGGSDGSDGANGSGQPSPSAPSASPSQSADGGAGDGAGPQATP
jgi:hypothetical protein